MELGVLDKPSFEESLRELAARRLAAEGHPTPEDLATYHAGELASDPHERIKDHLAICEDCSRLLLDLAEFERFEPAREGIAPADAHAEASWQRLRERLREEGGGRDETGREEEASEDEAVPILKPFPSRRRVPVWRQPALPWALAAGLALCVVGLGLRMGSLGRQLEELSRPHVVRAVALSSEEESTRGGNEGPLVRTGERVAYDLLLSSDPEAPTYSLYSVEIVPAAGDAESIPVGRMPAEDGFLRVVLPAAPEPGHYSFQVSGAQGETETPVGRYPFTILSPKP
jgi:hypothetical protein